MTPDPNRGARLIRYHLQNADVSPGDRAELEALADHLDRNGDAYRLKNIHDHSPADACRRSCPAYGDMLMEKTAARFNLTQTQNERGEWVPAIPLPLYVGFLARRCRCDCGQTFRNARRYREHYALRHILGLS